MKIVIKNIGQIVGYRDSQILKGDELNRLPVLTNKDIVIKDGIIEFIGDVSEEKGDITIDADKRVVMPGFVDTHTHTIFAGERSNEFAQRAAGVPYMEIAQKGGGILSTVKSTRECNYEELKDLTIKRLKNFILNGTTTYEIKSGYGLDTETEMKMLKVCEDLKKEGFNIVATFMGAHEVPPEYKGKKDQYISLVVDEMMPLLKDYKNLKFVDVFCEDKVFNKDESQYILEKGKEYGLLPRIHAEEIGYTGGAKMASQMGAISADHLLLIKDEDLDIMAENNTAAVVLPGTSFILKKNYAPVRNMIDKNVHVVLASDFNPGSCPIYRMDIIIGISVLYAGFTLEEAINASTVNAARLLGFEDRGVIKEGYKGDIVIWDMKDYRELPYWFGGNGVRWTIVNDIVYKTGE